ncbi:MAG TPA: WD40 repeat domain-containing protein, partial [Candidatus Dormibacteraeota bacterium]
SPDGAALASGGSDRVARIWSPEQLTLTRTLAGDTATVWGVSWAADSRRLVTASADGTLAVWSAR